MVLNVAKLRAQATELDTQLATTKHTATSPDGVVTAVVNGLSELLDLTISAAAVRGAHPQQIGPAAVAAITAARRAAMAAALPQVRAVLDDKLTWQPTPPTGSPAGPDLRQPALPPPQERAAAPATQRRQAEEESFEELDFLTDDVEPDTDRGRW